jgi:excisionase family DNA binding protein
VAKSDIREALMQENLLTTEQVAQYLKIDKFTVYRLVIQKKIPAFKVGNQWRFKKNMVEAWLNSNMNTKSSKLVSIE